MNGEGRAHTAAVVAAIAAQGVTVYNGGAPDSPVLPYCAVFSDAGRGLATSMGQSTDQYVHTFQTTSVGTSQEQAAWVAEKVREALSGKTLTIAGWSTQPVQHIMAGIDGRDYDAPTNIDAKYDQWRYRAVPTS